MKQLRALTALLIGLVTAGLAAPSLAQTQGFVGGSPPSYADVIGTIDGSGNVQRVGPTTPLPATLATSAYSASATFTPAASSHVANDANGAAGTFALIGPSAGRIIITSATLEIDGGSAEATAWRLYLYNVSPPSAIADDGAWDLGSGDRASYLGYVDIGTAVDLGSTQWVQVHILNQQVKLAGTSLFGYLVNLTTLTPAAVAHIVTLHAVGL